MVENMAISKTIEIHGLTKGLLFQLALLKDQLVYFGNP